MMNGQGKSDLGIVAVKPTNKAGRPGAESAEPRPGTKGNAEQQRMHRTQSRARMSQSLNRVRTAARLRKKDRFTALFHHINVDTLRTAFYALRRKAAPGVDGMTWQDYEEGIEPRLADLHKRVQRGAYRPQPSRRTYIPKADGKQRPLRSRHLKTKSSRVPPSSCSTPSMKATSVAFRTGSDPDEGRMMGWMRYARRSKSGR